VRSTIGVVAGLIFSVSTGLVVLLMLVVRLFWRRGKDLEEP
jgi:cytochrome b561